MKPAAARVSALALFLQTLLMSGCFGGTANEWAYEMVGLRKAQEQFNGDGITVAIIDTGIDANHSSLHHAKVLWKDFVNNRPYPYDDYGHGTHVAGILVGKGGSFGGKLQGFNLKGAITADHPQLIVAKVIRKDQSGSSDAVAAGINFATQNKADVICLSLGSKPTQLTPILSQTTNVKQAIDTAVAAGIVVVASAGNVGEGESQNDVAFPAGLDNVIAVGAVTKDKTVASFSARGSEDANEGPAPLRIGGRDDPNKKPEIVAPGDGIKSAWINGDYAIAKGTSQAAPFVCGAIALLLQKCPALRAANSSDTVVRIKNALKASTEPLKGQRTPHDNAAGYGLLRADQLLDRFQSPC